MDSGPWFEFKVHDHIHLACRLQQSDVYTRKMRNAMRKQSLGGGGVKKRFLEIKYCFGYIHNI